MPIFSIPAGTRCEVSQRHADQWRPWTTTKPLTFDEPESRTRSFVVFRDWGWELRVKPDRVRFNNGKRWQMME